MKSASGENSTKLRLRIPAPARGEHPPDRVRYISRAGEMQKPALDEKVERIALMRKQLARVLDDERREAAEVQVAEPVEDRVPGAGLEALGVEGLEEIDQGTEGFGEAEIDPRHSKEQQEHPRPDPQRRGIPPRVPSRYRDAR